MDLLFCSDCALNDINNHQRWTIHKILGARHSSPALAPAHDRQSVIFFQIEPNYNRQSVSQLSLRQ